MSRRRKNALIAPRTPGGSVPMSEFEKLAKRMAQMEQELADLKAGQDGNELTPDEIRERVQAETQEEKARQHQQALLNYDYVISTNVLADITRLLSDNIYQGLGAMRPGRDPESEELRLGVATEMLESTAQQFCAGWLDYKPTLTRTWLELPPQEARQSLITDLQAQVESNIANNSEVAVSSVVAEATEGPVSHSFNHMDSTSAAAREGVELAAKIIENVFDQLRADMPGAGRVNAAEDGADAIQLACDIAMGYAQANVIVSGAPQTHEELFDSVYKKIAQNAVNEAFVLAASGRGSIASIPQPLRIAGAILSEMGLPQVGLNGDMDESEQEDIENRNTYPTENVKSAQLREMARVIDSIQDSIYDGQLRAAVYQTYEHNAQTHFPQSEVKRLTPDMHDSAYGKARDILEDLSANLTDEAQKLDGWVDPDVVPPSSKTWVGRAAPTMQ